MNIRRIIKKGQFQFEKNKGLIFTVLAGTFEIAAIVAMAKQSPKAEKVLAPANKRIEELKEENKDTEKVDNKLVDPEKNKKEIRSIQKQTFLQLAKIYAVPVIFTGLSLTFMGGSYKVMRDKEIAIGAAYVTLDNAYKAYRNRVKEKFGEEAESEIFNDIRKKKVLRTTEDAATGEIKEIEGDAVKACEGEGYALLFDAAALSFSRDGRTNYETLSQKEKELTQILRLDGYLFLSTAIDVLGIPKSCINKDLLSAARVVGWVDTPDEEGRPKKVLLGINDYYGHANSFGSELFNREENTVWLCPNVDGPIATIYPDHAKD